MNIDQLTGRYVRLKKELETAYTASSWHDAHISRLADDIVSIERQLCNSFSENKQLAEADQHRQATPA